MKNSTGDFGRFHLEKVSPGRPRSLKQSPAKLFLMPAAGTEPTPQTTGDMGDMAMDRLVGGLVRLDFFFGKIMTQGQRR